MEYTFENRHHFDIEKQLMKKLLFLSRIEQYVDDANKKGNKQAEMSLQILKSVEQRNADLLHRFLVAEKNGN